MASFIEVQGVTKIYGEEDSQTRALNGVGLTIDAGEFVSIMGPSGSGKSTLLHILGLLDRPTKGRYLLDGRDTAEFSDEKLAGLRSQRIGFIFQAYHLLSRTSVLDNVMLPLQYTALPIREHKQRSLAALEQVNMTHRLSHTPGQLSGGEKQRVAIARALVNQPSLILADEPTGNLDTKTGEVVMALIDSLHKQGHTVIVITHEMTAAEYAQRIIKVRDGMVESDQAVTNTHKHYVK